jgi:hypothetical protein
VNAADGLRRSADLCGSQGIFSRLVLHIDSAQIARLGAGRDQLVELAESVGMVVHVYGRPAVEAELRRFEAAGGTRPLEGEARAEHWRLRLAQTLSTASGWTMHHPNSGETLRDAQGLSHDVR